MDFWPAQHLIIFTIFLTQSNLSELLNYNIYNYFWYQPLR